MEFPQNLYHPLPAAGDGNNVFCAFYGGVSISAFGPEAEIVSGLMAFWCSKRNAVTEDIFVLSPWMRQGIASRLVVEGIEFLVVHG